MAEYCMEEAPLLSRLAEILCHWNKLTAHKIPGYNTEFNCYCVLELQHVGWTAAGIIFH